MTGDIEYGDTCFVTAVGGRSVPPPISRKAASRYETKVIEGTATKHNSVLFHDGKFKVVAPGAFDLSMKYDVPVEFWIDHDRSLKLGDTRTNLELYSDDFGLHFRLRLDNTELSSHARALVESKAYTECSVGFDSGKTELREIEGHSVLYILQARLEEVSLVPAGAVKATHAQVNDIENCRSLEHDCKSMKFRCDNSYASLHRALRRAAS
jgi:HK97 family phage prohead protease